MKKLYNIFGLELKKKAKNPPKSRLLKHAEEHKVLIRKERRRHRIARLIELAIIIVVGATLIITFVQTLNR